jgi:hypothetical protein
MCRGNFKPFVLIVALGLAACGQSEQADAPSAPPAATAAAVEPDPEPKFIGAPSPQWQSAGDAIRDETLVRDVTFAAEGRGATVEVIVQPADAAVRVQLLNNESVVLAEANASAGAETRLTGQATAGDRNMVRIIRETRTSAPTPFSVRIRTVPESN